MSRAKRLSNEEVYNLAFAVTQRIRNMFPGKDIFNVYGVPRGGIPAAYAVTAVSKSEFKIVDYADDADVLIDDLIDSGRTMERWTEHYPNRPFLGLIDKRESVNSPWVVFPWEDSDPTSDMEDTITRLIQHIGEDVTRAGLKETPARVTKAWKHWTAGYKTRSADIFKIFDEAYDKHMVMTRGIRFYSHCEHHLAPFFGHVNIAYLPHNKVIGLSKLSRLVDMFSRRLQVQERLTREIASELFRSELDPYGVAVEIRARHLCVESRGVCKPEQETVTTCLLGLFETDIHHRQEFFAGLRS